jgi:O-antigen ligase
MLFCSVLLPIQFAVDPGPLFEIGPTRALMGAWLLGASLHLVVHGRLAEHGKASYPLLAIILVYLLSSSVSAAMSVKPLVSFYAVVGREIIEQFLLFYVFIYYFRSPGFFRRLRLTLYAATVFVILFAVGEQIARANPFLPFYPDDFYQYRAGMLRVRATFFHPIALGCYINLIFPFALVDFLLTKRMDKRVALAALMLGMLAVSFMTVSRGPWLTLAMEVGIFIIWLSRKHLARLFLILVASGLIISTAFLAYQTNETVHRLFRPVINPTQVEEWSTEYYRYVVVRSIIRYLAQERLLFGFGPNSFSFAGVEAQYASHSRVLTAPDQHYARIAFEYGAVGATLFVILIGAGTWKTVAAIRRTRDRPDQQLYAVAAFGTVVAFIVENLTVSMFTMYPLGMLFWMHVALACALPMPRETRRGKELPL